MNRKILWVRLWIGRGGEREEKYPRAGAGFRPVEGNRPSAHEAVMKPAQRFSCGRKSRASARAYAESQKTGPVMRRKLRFPGRALQQWGEDFRRRGNPACFPAGCRERLPPCHRDLAGVPSPAFCQKGRASQHGCPIGQCRNAGRGCVRKAANCIAGPPADSWARLLYIGQTFAADEFPGERTPNRLLMPARPRAAGA